MCPSCAFEDLLPGLELSPQPTDESSSSVALDAQFGRYILRERLASGGMGVVYTADDQQLKRTVALKMIRGSSFADSAEISRFTLEAEAAAALDHPNIVPIYEVGLEEGQPFFTMKLIGGESLAARLRRLRGNRMDRIGTRAVADWLSQIAHAVHHAHQRGILHRDIKPGNILIDEANKPWLTDFGLAKLVHRDTGLTKSSDHLGTPNYMPPEILDGAAVEASVSGDIWALGVILWEALCGKPPFGGSNPMEIMRKIAEEEPSIPRGETVDRDLITLACRCLEKDPSRRIQSAALVAEELQRWLRGEPLTVRRITPGERALKFARRKPVWAALILALLGGGFSSMLLWHKAEKAVDELTFTNSELEDTLAASKATRLALDARLQVTKKPDLALLLAAEAVELTEKGKVGVLPESAEALFEVLQRVGGWDVSPNGSRVTEHYTGFIIDADNTSYPAIISPDGDYTLNFSAPSEGARVDAAVLICKHRELPWIESRSTQGIVTSGPSVGCRISAECFRSMSPGPSEFGDPICQVMLQRLPTKNPGASLRKSEGWNCLGYFSGSTSSLSPRRTRSAA